jgi:hypothetical protein
MSCRPLSSPTLHAAIARSAIGATFAALAISSAFAQTTAAAGTVAFSIGEARIVGADGNARSAIKGSTVTSGDTVETGGGRIQLRMVDGGYVSLQPQTQLRVDNYRFERGDDGSERGFLSLLKGGFRTVTGLIGKRNRQNYLVNTATATIGIRGTEFAVTGGGAAINVGEGEVAVCNNGGCAYVGVGQTALVPSIDIRPEIVLRAAELPPPPPPVVLPVVVTGDFRAPDGSQDFLPTPPLVEGGGNPLPNVILASGPGGVSLARITPGGFSAGLLGGSLTIDPVTGAMTTFLDCCGSGNYRNAVVAEQGSNGVVAWGRWTGGTVDTGGPPQPLTMIQYAGSTLTPNAAALANLVGTYTVVGSTAPVVHDVSNNVTGVGVSNAVSGSLSVNFATGITSVNLSIVAGADNFSMSGSGVFEKASATDSRFFIRTGSITSSDGNCSSVCTGIIPFGPLMSGQLHGEAAEGASGVYGFTSDLGKITGAVAFGLPPP